VPSRPVAASRRAGLPAGNPRLTAATAAAGEGARRAVSGAAVARKDRRLTAPTQDTARIVVSYFPGVVADHQRATVGAIGRAVAALLGSEFEGEYDSAARYGRRLYFVPSDTLLADEARPLGIHSREDLFGGVVPFPFVATKAIAHPLVASDAYRPRGWSNDFTDRVREAVLPGFTAFTVPDIRRAAAQLVHPEIS
jgi:Protein of unknown function (DUF3182)